MEVRTFVNPSFAYSQISLTFSIENDRKHVNEDHNPYICISENCPDSYPRFATSGQWFQHMLTTHGQSWNREAYPPSLWICSFCNDDDTTFSFPDELNNHLTDNHGDIFTGTQAQSIVRQSRVRSLRPRNICPLCCLDMEDQQNSTIKDKTKKKPRDESKVHVNIKRIKTEAGHAGQDRHAVGDGHQVSTKPEQWVSRASADAPQMNHLTVESIASHIAGHLQTIMLLTLRLISIDVAMDVSADNWSASNSTDHGSSRAGSLPTDIDQESDTMEGISFNNDGNVIYNEDNFSAGIPDTKEHLNWNDVRLDTTTLVEDNFLEKVIISGAFQSHINHDTIISMKVSAVFAE